MMLTDRAEVSRTLNAKANELGDFMGKFEFTLMTEEDFDRFKTLINAELDRLNAKYPKTKPFELYNFTYRSVYIVPQGRSDVRVASMRVVAVHNVMSGERPLPVELFKVVRYERV